MAFSRKSGFQRPSTTILAVAAVSFLATSQVLAASLTQDGDTIVLSGEISPGDLSNLTNIVFSKPLNNQDWTLSLNSGGGDFDEGIKLANFVNANHVRTLVAATSKCNSSCALIFLGGSSGAEGNVIADRSLELGAALGFHAPFSRSGQNAGAGQTQATLEKGLQQLNVLLTTFGIPDSIRPFLTTNDDQHSLYDATTVEAIELLDITLGSPIYSPSKITKAMALNSCINGYIYGLGKLPSETRAANLADYQRIKSASPHRIFTSNGDETFAIIPALNLEPGVVGDCKITAGGVCGGVYAHGLSASEYVTEAFVAACQRNNIDTTLVPPNTRITDVKQVLQRMEADESELLSSIEEINNSEVAEPSPKQFNDEQIALAPSQGVICNQSLGIANVRTGPNATQFNLVATLKNQQRVEVLEPNVANPASGHIWKKIRWESGEGFVDGDLVQPTCLIAFKPPVIPTPTPFKEFEAQICNAGGDSANLRSGPNPKLDGIVKNIINLESVTVIGVDNNPQSGHLWYKVRYGEVVGFIDNELVDQACKIIVEPPKEAALSGESAVMCNPNSILTNMRAGPNPDQFELLRSLANFVDVRILESTTNPVSGHPWLKISVDGVEGFVDADAVKSSCE